WPTAGDSINHRWNGATTDSPAAKYGKAFGVADVENQVSKTFGIDRYSSRTACTTDAQCNDKIGEACSKRTGATSGYCIPTWWGICHDWVPASILEAEPVYPVTRNGVTFKPNDIKALITVVYEGSSSKFVSLRCDEDEADNAITYDGYGRPTGDDVECKDTNPGTYHVILTNYLGLRGQAFAEDRTFDDEVWNQPLRAYRITQQKLVTALEANKLVGVTGSGAMNNQTFSKTAMAAGSWHHQPAYTVLPGTTVRVETTSAKDVDLYVKVGAQPTDAAYDCRPYDGTGNEVCEVVIPAGQTKLFVSVNAYEGPADVQVKVAIPTSTAGVPTTYVFNDKAASLYHVKLEVDYITESPGSTDGNLASRINDFTRTDRYEYILEVDSAGKINGGEWIGASKKAHPDFLWLPTGRGSGSVANGTIDYAQVKSLLEESIAGPGGGSTASQVLKEESATLAQGEWKYFGPYTDVASGFSATMTGTGDADIYVKKGAQPTASAYDCRPYGGDSNESCAPAGAGPWYIAVNGYKASTVKITVRYTKTGGTTPTPTPTTTHLNISGNVAAGAMLTYTIPVYAGKKIVVRTQAAADVDLYIKMNVVPTVNVYDQRGYTDSGNETLTLVPGANGTLNIAVHGYATSAFKLTTADN
ncbi:MAG: pre-peptidase C-terminal domain-containing protein, partial [Deltaproteobacteria bacterium]|nr:pre-peptidase C-terminal domain-containing protein [Deltaproteobacteria bacterium]